MNPVRRRKPTSGLKFLPTANVLDLDAETIGIVVEARAVAVIVAVEAGRASAGVVADDGQALEEREVGVDAEHACCRLTIRAPSAGARCREDPSDTCR